MIYNRIKMHVIDSKLLRVSSFVLVLRCGLPFDSNFRFGGEVIEPEVTRTG